MYKEPNKIRNEKSKCLLGREKKTVGTGDRDTAITPTV